jgi:hypothetical protein
VKIIPQASTTTAIFFLHKDEKELWVASIRAGSPGYMLLNAQKRVSLGEYSVSLSDFKKGIALYEKHYMELQEKRAYASVFILENPTKNKTYYFLAKDFVGYFIDETTPNPFENAQNDTLVVKKRKKVVKKRKK